MDADADPPAPMDVAVASCRGVIVDDVASSRPPDRTTRESRLPLAVALVVDEWTEEEEEEEEMPSSMSGGSMGMVGFLRGFGMNSRVQLKFIIITATLMNQRERNNCPLISRAK